MKYILGGALVAWLFLKPKQSVTVIPPVTVPEDLPPLTYGTIDASGAPDAQDVTMPVLHNYGNSVQSGTALTANFNPVVA